MNGFRLPEFDPASEHQQLHALIRLPGHKASGFSALFSQRCPGIIIRHHPDQELLLLVFPEAGDSQGFAFLLAKTLDEFAASTDGQVPEVLEIRLAPGADRGCPQPLFSRHIRLLEHNKKKPESGLWLKLEYGTSFGSGQHPSTRLAMQALDDLYEIENTFPATMLDVGCGSGVLALSGAIFGAGRVLGIDIDADSLSLAVDNARRNNLDDRVGFTGQSPGELGDSFELIAANLTGAVLSGMLADFERLTARPGGWLVISGLQGRQLEEICSVLEKGGFALERTYREDSWRAALLAAVDRRP